MSKKENAQAQAQEQAQATELSLVEQAQASVKVATNLEEAINLHMGKSAFETGVDGDGNEYVKARFNLLAPTKEHSEIVVNDISLARKIEAMRKLVAMGEVSNFAFCRLLANIADSDASSLGFDSTEELANAITAKGKSTLANYKRIGLYFVNDDDTFSLRGAIPQESSISLLNQLLVFVTKENDKGQPDISNVECLFKYGIITPYQKQKDYKRICSTLTSMKSEKELKDMTEEEVEQFKHDLALLLNAKKPSKKEAKDDNKNEEPQEQEQAQALTIASDDPKVILGQSINMLHTMIDSIPKLKLEQEQADLLVTWFENIVGMYSEMLG